MYFSNNFEFLSFCDFFFCYSEALFRDVGFVSLRHGQRKVAGTTILSWEILPVLRVLSCRNLHLPFLLAITKY